MRKQKRPQKRHDSIIRALFCKSEVSKMRFSNGTSSAGELLREGEDKMDEVCYFQKQFGILPKDYVKKGE